MYIHGTLFIHLTKLINIGGIYLTISLSLLRISSLCRTLVNCSRECLVSSIILRIILGSVLARASSSYRNSYRKLIFLRAKDLMKMLFGMSLAKGLCTNYKNKKNKWTSYVKNKNKNKNIYLNKRK